MVVFIKATRPCGAGFGFGINVNRSPLVSANASAFRRMLRLSAGKPAMH